MAENLDAIVTRNTKDYKNSTVKIYSPDEFLQSFTNHLKIVIFISQNQGKNGATIAELK